jgi:hypothetical protein
MLCFGPDNSLTKDNTMVICSRFAGNAPENSWAQGALGGPKVLLKGSYGPSRALRTLFSEMGCLEGASINMLGRLH